MNAAYATTIKQFLTAKRLLPTGTCPRWLPSGDLPETGLLRQKLVRQVLLRFFSKYVALVDKHW